MKTIARIIVGLVGLALIAGVAVRGNALIGLMDSAQGLDLEGVNFQAGGLDEINLTAALPIMQIFMGKAAVFEDFELPQASAEAVGSLNLTLPPGWAIGQDESGADMAYQTGTSTVVVLEDQDGNSAVVARTTVPNPPEFLSNTTNQYITALETSGATVNAYSTIMEDGRQAQAIDVQQGDLTIQIRAWISGSDVFVVALTADMESLSVSQQVFSSLA